MLDIDRRQLAAIRSRPVVPEAPKPARRKHTKAPVRAKRTAPPEAPYEKALRLMRRLSQNATFGDGRQVARLERQIDRLLAS